MDQANAGTDSLDKSVNEKVLILFNVRHGLAPYSHAFVDKLMDVQVLSGFVSAILSFMQEALGSAQTSWKTEYGADSTLIVEEGEWIVGVLAVSRVTMELRSKVRSIVKRFERDFKFLKDVDYIEGGIYNEFDRIVRQEFVDNRISDRSILVMHPDWRTRGRSLPVGALTKEVVRLLAQSANRTTLGEISTKLGMGLKEVMESASEAAWSRLASLIYVPSDSDLLSLSEGSSGILLGRGNPIGIGADTVLLLSMMDGRSNLAQLLEMVDPDDKDATLRELGSLLNRGYVQRESFERILVFVMECIVSSLLVSSGKFLGIAATTSLVRSALKRGSHTHPWIGRIAVDGDFHARCRLDDSMSPTDLDDVRAALTFLQERIREDLTTALGQEKAEDLILRAQLNCHQQWSAQMDASSEDAL